MKLFHIIINDRCTTQIVAAETIEGALTFIFKNENDGFFKDMIEWSEGQGGIQYQEIPLQKGYLFSLDWEDPEMNIFPGEFKVWTKN